jgi:hypothetical protein
MPFHGVLGEDLSDADAVAALVRRLREERNLARIKIKRHGYEGCAQLMRKGAEQLKFWAKTGCLRAVICHDADKNDPETVRHQVEKRIIRKSRFKIPCCAVVPTQELEAWLLADIQKLGELYSWCSGLKEISEPEQIQDPKEHLIRLTRHPDTHETHYHPPTDNEAMARIVDLDLVERKCPSFAVLADFVRSE